MSAPTPPLIKTNNRVFPSSIRFYWSPPVSTGDSPISSYTLTCSSIAFQESYPNSVLNAYANPLPSNTTYIFQIYATNSNGNQGDPATYIPYQTGTRPFAPSNITFSTLAYSEATLISWSTANTGGSDLKYNAIWIYPIDTNSNILSNVSSFTKKQNQYGNKNTALVYIPTVDSNYKLTVRAINSIGWSSDSNYEVMYLTRYYDPSTIATPSFWIDPTVSSSLLYNYESTLTRITSLTNSNDFLAGEYGFKVIPSTLNSKNVFLMDGSQVMSNLTVGLSNSGYTIFTVFFTFSSNAGYERYITQLQDARLFIGPATSSIAIFNGNGTNWNDVNINTPAFTTTSNWRIVTASYFNNSSFYTAVDGNFQNPKYGPYSNYDSFLMGGQNYTPQFKGYSAETIVYPFSLNPFERQKVEGYLAWKWGLQSNLPPAHPFRTFKPEKTSVFNPRLYSSLKLWLDADDPNGTGVKPSNGTFMNTWVDKSGSGNNATAAGTTPTYNTTSNAIVFNGAGYYNTNYSASLSNESLFVVFRKITGAQDESALVGQSGDGGRFFTTRTTNNRLEGSSYNLNEGTRGVTNSIVLNRIHLGELIVTNGNQTSFVTGASQGTSVGVGYTAGRTSKIGVGFLSGAPRVSQYFTGTMCEILGFDRSLSFEERQTVEGYLAWKWGIQSNLPALHFFVDNNPAVLSTIGIPTNGNIIHFNASTYSGVGVWSNLGSLGTNYNASIASGSISKNPAGNGVVFNGSSHFSFSNPNLGNSFTLGAWFKRTGNPTGINAAIVTDGPTNVTGSTPINAFLVNSYQSGGTSNTVTGGFVASSDYRVGTSLPFNLNEWHFMCITWNGSNLRTYYDGSLSNDTSLAYTASTTGENYLIGREWNYLTPDYIVGEIGQIFMYNRPIEPAEVTSIFRVTRSLYSNPQFPNDQIVRYNARQTISTGSTNLSNFGTLGPATMTLSTGTFSTNSTANGIVFTGSTSYRAVSTGTIDYKNISQYSLSLWFKRTGSNDLGGCAVAARFNTASPFYFGRLSNDNANEMRLGVFNGTTSSLGVKYDYPDNAWIHYTAVHSGSNIATYINGALFSSLSTTVSIPSYTGTTYLGYNGTAAFVRGELGDFSLYNRLLSQRDVTLLYNSSFSSYYQRPYWNFTPSNFSNNTWSNSGAIQNDAFNPRVTTGTISTTSNSLYFDGSTYMQLSTLSSIPLSSFTLGVWIKKTIPYLRSYGIFVQGGENDGYIIGPSIYFDSGALYIGYHSNGWTRSPAFNLEQDRWTHFCSSYDFTTKQYRTYLNGILWNTFTASTPPRFSGGTYRFSEWWGSVPSGNTLVGEMGELSFYNVALSEQEIYSYYTSTTSIYSNSTPPLQKLLEYSGTNYPGTGVWSNTGTLGSAFNAAIETGTPSLNFTSNGVVFDGLTNFLISSMSTTNEYTITAWVRRTAPGRSYSGIFSRQYVNNYFDYSFYNTNLGYGNYIISPITNNGAPVHIQTSIPDVWMQITTTFDGYSSRTYSNGILGGITNTSNLISQANNSISRIGNRWDGAARFVGEIGYLSMYNNSLSSNDIYREYLSTASFFSTVTRPNALLLQYDASNYTGSGSWSNLGSLGSYYNASIETGTPSKNGVGNGVVFSGTMNFQLSNVPLNRFTVSVWLKRTSASLAPSGQYGFYFSQVYTSDPQYMNFVGGANYQGANISSIVNSYYYNGGWISNNPILTPLNQWILITCTHDGSNLRSYSNDTLIHSLVNTNIPESGTHRFRIGRGWDTGNNFLVGEIGELRVYNYALTLTEISTLYSTTVSRFAT